MERKRESFGSRLGFILVSAGCAIGIGNVWKFPYLCGQYGGAAFILIYLVFLVIMGIPIMTIEFSIGRKSRLSAAKAFEKLEPAGTRWHHLKWISIIGCYMLMMFYTTVCGWMFSYCFRSLGGEFAGKDAGQIGSVFEGMLGNAPGMTFWTVLVCVLGFVVCFFGIQKGIEKVTKVMMTALLILMVILAVHSVFLKGAGEGIRFYLVPDFNNIAEKGIGNVLYNAMSQAFFTLSIGIGAMLIFGSYIEQDRSLTGESVIITILDTAVALMSGFIIIPACFAYGVQPDAGPRLIFLTIPNIFAKMPGGRFWGALFFVFLSFAAFSTVIAVFENIIACDMELTGDSRKNSVLKTAVLVILLSLPCTFGFNLLSFVRPFGSGSTILDLEDFIVSNNLLPLGSLAFVLFATKKNGWGWEGFIRETNAGRGMRFPERFRGYVEFGIPALVIVIFVKGYYDKFAPMGILPLAVALVLAACLIGFIFWSAGGSAKQKNTV